MPLLTILAFLGFGYGIYMVGKNMHSKLDHSFIPSTPLDPDAKIIDISSEKVIYVKNGAKYKTKVTFSDGFVFTTHKTKREDGWWTYNISIDSNLAIEIIECAINAHTKACIKQNVR